MLRFADGLPGRQLRISLHMALFPEIQFSMADQGSGSALCDETLMERITQRQQPALDELYLRCGRSLRALIGSVVREESEADDVLQESFLQIWREARNYSPRAGKPLGWVITIARRRAIDRVRRRRSYRRGGGGGGERGRQERAQRRG